MANVTDIVITSRDRYSYLKKTLNFLFSRTTSPHRLTVLDDGSTDSRIHDLLVLEVEKGRIDQVFLRSKPEGQRMNMWTIPRLTLSDPVVVIDDDVLCPQVDPDWLSRGLTAMRENRDLAMLALNHPGAKKKPIRRWGPVTYCRSIGGTFLFVRRFLFGNLPYKEQPGDFGRAIEPLCLSTRKAGRKIGYLTDTWCYHIGKESVQDGKPYAGKFIEPVDWKTLDPGEEHRG